MGGSHICRKPRWGGGSLIGRKSRCGGGDPISAGNLDGDGGVPISAGNIDRGMPFLQET